MDTQINVSIKNMPEGVEDKRYIVATYINNEFWYFGAFDDADKARECVQYGWDFCRLVIDRG